MQVVDFETKSGTDISRGHDAYFRDPEAGILCLSWAPLEGGPVESWWPGCGWDPISLWEAAKRGELLLASHAAFDQGAWEYLAVALYGFPEVPADQWFCTQAQSRCAGLPSALEDATRAAKVKHKKSRKGAALIQRMSIPPFEHTPKLLAEMVEYCEEDILSARDLANAIPLMSPRLFEDYRVNERINERGVKIDRKMCVAAAKYASAERDEIGGKLALVTGGDVTLPTQHQRFAKWLRLCLEEDGCTEAVKLMVRWKRAKKDLPKKGIKKGESVKRYSSDKPVRRNLISGAESLRIDPVLVEAMQLMNDASGAATSKYAKMVLLADKHDDRVRGVLRAFGASSSLRYSSMVLQLHNMKRDAFELEDLLHYRAQILRGATLTDPKTGKPAPIMETLGKGIRGAIIPEEGNVFVVGDWSAVQSRLTAAVSRDEDKLNLFRRGECPYEYAAEGIYGRKITKKDDPKERQIGKVVDLAAGFLGGEGALVQMASTYDVYIEEDKRKSLIDGWRAKHPKIVKYGNLLFSKALAAMRHVGTWHHADKVAYIFDGSALWCRLPDGETMLRYPEARVEMVPAPWATPEDRRPQMVANITALKAALTMAADGDEWPRHSLWRGLLLNNVVQGCEAIMLRDLCFIFQDIAVFHVHDEIVLEVPAEIAEAVIAWLRREMRTPPWWCPELPLEAEPEIMVRYGKGK